MHTVGYNVPIKLSAEVENVVNWMCVTNWTWYPSNNVIARVCNDKKLYVSSIYYTHSISYNSVVYKQ